MGGVEGRQFSEDVQAVNGCGYGGQASVANNAGVVAGSYAMEALQVAGYLGISIGCSSLCKGIRAWSYKMNESELTWM